MAETSKNKIYYNDDENSVADVLMDMEKLAQSTDDAIEKSKYDDTSIKKEISNIKTEQVTQNNNISNLQKENEELKEENKHLREDLNGLPSGTVSGENIDITDSAEMRCELNISGNSKQDGEPRPAVPVEVESCGDNVNLLNISSNNGTVIRILDDEATISYDNEVVKVTRNVINHSNAQTGIFYAFKTEKGKEYTVTPVFSSVGTANVRVFKDNTNTTVLSGNITSGDSYTFIAEQGQYWLRFWISNNFVGDSILCAKVVEGREATSYSPYGQGCINEVICNKNISNIEKFDVSGGIGLTYPKIIQGLKENTEYTLSFYKSRIIGTTISNTSLHGCRQIHFYHNEKKLSEYTYNSPVSNFSSGNRKFEIKINTPSKCNKIICYFDNSNGDNNVNTMVYDIQLEEGTATDYKEHKSQTYTIPTQQPFRAIENTRDTFIKKNNKWYERHYSSRYVFTGNEEWRKHESIKNNAYYLNPLSNPIKDMMKKPTNNKEALPLYSNRFIYKSTEDIAFSNIEGISISVLGDIYIGTTLSGISSLDELKTYLQQNKTYFDFLLQTPTDIECTEEQNKILDKIENEAKTYKNVTHVYSIDKVSPNAEITYKKDLETLFSNTVARKEV